MIATIIILGLLAPPIYSYAIEGKGWRGLVPLYSTRTDVERLLGPGTNECKCGYYLDDVNVFFQYSSSDCKAGGSGGWNIPPGTIILFTVIPKPNPLIADLDIDLSRFKKKADGHIEGVVYYSNEEEGISLEVYEGRVQAYFYQPRAKDEQKRCP